MRILIVGVGGVGGFIGSQINSSDLEIVYVARGERLKFLKKNGLKVKSKLGEKVIENLKIFDSIPAKVKFDVVICTVKLYDFDDFIRDFKSTNQEDTIILPFQNGIYSEQKLIEEFGEKKTYGAVAQISSFVDNTESIIHKGSLATFFVGSMGDLQSDKLRTFCEKCQKSGLDMRLKPNIKEKIWEKFIFLSAYSGITTLTENTIGEIFASQKLKDLFINAMRETYNLSKFFGVKFESDPIDYWLGKIKKMPHDMTSSMYIDYTKKKKLELDWLSGFIVNYSEKFGNDCSTHKLICRDILIK